MDDIKVYLYSKGQIIVSAPRLNMIHVPDVGELLQVELEDHSVQRYRILKRQWIYRTGNRTTICALLIEPVAGLFDDFA